MRHDTYTPGGTARAPLAKLLPRTPASALSRAGSKLMCLIQLTVFLALAGVAFAGSKIAPDLKANSRPTVDVIVQFVNPPTKQQLKQLGAYGRMKNIFDGLNAAHLTLPMSVVQALANDPSILYISPDRDMAGALDLADPTTNATAAWQQYGIDGTGVGVAVIDSGVSLKNDLKTKDKFRSRRVYSERFVRSGEPSDLYGHGSHVGGL